MCLTTNQEKPKIAGRDIPCWIVARIIDEEKRTAFEHVKITPKMKSKLTLFDGEVSIGLHSLARLRDAKSLMGLLKWEYNNRYTILKCIIPAGSEYYKGKFNLWRGDLIAGSYASNKRNLVISKKAKS